MKKSNHKIVVFLIVNLFILSNAFGGNDKPFSFITGVGSTHFEAHRMARNAANSSRVKISEQISQRSSDGTWHVILKVRPK